MEKNDCYQIDAIDKKILINGELSQKKVYTSYLSTFLHFFCSNNNNKLKILWQRQIDYSTTKNVRRVKINRLLKSKKKRGRGLKTNKLYVNIARVTQFIYNY